MQLNKMKLGDVADDGGILCLLIDNRGLCYSGAVLIPRSRLRRAMRFGWRIQGKDNPNLAVVTVYRSER